MAVTPWDGPFDLLHPSSPDRYLVRELDRGSQPSSLSPSAPRSVAVVGAGRLGTALAAALRAADREVEGPLGRDLAPHAPVVLLCVPDAAIPAAAGAVAPEALVGHCSGAGGLSLLGDREGFSLHPLMTVTPAGARFAGAAAAVDGTSEAALAAAVGLAEALGMRPIRVAAADRVAYHAAASIASNFLVTLESAAETVAGLAGIGRADLVPLVRATVENWASLGAREALTGPVARGDEPTVAAQRAVVAERAPELLGLFDELVGATRALAGRRREAVSAP